MKKLLPPIGIIAACAGSFLLGAAYRPAEAPITSEIANYASKVFVRLSLVS